MKEEIDPKSFDKVLDIKRETYLNNLIKKNFEDINKIILKCISKNETIKTIRQNRVIFIIKINFDF